MSSLGRMAGSASRTVSVVVSVLLAGLAGTSPPAAAGGPPASWTLPGQNVQADRNQPAEHTVGAANVAALKQKWAFTTHGDVSATPTVSGGVVYATDFGGYLYAVNARTGRLIWQHQISAYDGATKGFSRTSPLVLGDELVIGDQIYDPQYHEQGAHLIAVNRWTGALIWSTQVDADTSAKITGSPTAYGGNVYVGVSSNEELNIETPPCCTWVGKLVSVNMRTGKINWTFDTIPQKLAATCETYSPPSGCGYSGASIWSTPAIDPQLGALFIGTGNNYTVTDEANACELAARAGHTSDNNCTPPDDYQDTVLALDLKTGKVIWSRRIFAFDAWPGYCEQLPPDQPCTLPEGDDYDFGGSGPNVFTTTVGGKAKTVVGIGEKSGIYWAFDAKTGDDLWHTLAGPGSFSGGIQWGTSTDGKRIYTADANAGRASYTLTPSGQTVNTGIWSAIDPATGTILWQTPDPSADLPVDVGPTTVANDVVYAGSLETTGPNMFALDAATGKILWSFASGGSVACGPAVVDGTVYWGSGYTNASYFGATGNNKLYAFSLR